MDLERQLTRLLRTVDVPPAADPVADVRVGMRRRQRVRRTQAVVVALAVVGVGVGATTLVGPGDGHQVVSPLPGATVTSPATILTATRPPTPSAPPDVPVLVGEPGVDLSWVSAADGFALVSSACGQTTCTHLLRTSDGGQSWNDVHASGLPTACGTWCPLRVRFANANVGYVYGNGLAMTADGGRTWSAQPGPDTFGLEIAGGTVLRVVARTGCPGCPFTVQRATVGSSSWHDVYRSDLPRVAADLVRQGNRVAVTLRGNPAGGARDAHSTLLVSEDAGATWTQHPDPCDGTADDERDATQLTWSQDGVLVVLCQRRLTTTTGGNSSLMTSVDGGRTFSAPVSFATSYVPGGTDESNYALHVAAGQGVLLAELSLASQPEVTLQRSTDGGRSWAVVAQDSLPNGSVDGFLEFSSSSIATWVPPGHRRVWRSTDAGRTWTSYPLT